MKKFLVAFFLLFTFLMLSKAVYSQKLVFCEGVDSKGKPQSPSSTFSIPKGGGYFYFLVNLNGYELGCTYVNYDIYEVNSDNTETYSTTINQYEMQTSWTWFWKKVTFYTAGDYRVYVYDCNGSILTSAYLTITYK